jgi:monothiol glutaredoxin
MRSLGSIFEGKLMTKSTAERINDIVAKSDIVLFMKGVPAAPQCGFSAAVVQMLSRLAVPFASVDVLSDPEIREGIKAFSNWPTIPQLYIKGEFVGGCDIVREMFQAGELAAMLSEKGIVAPTS